MDDQAPFVRARLASVVAQRRASRFGRPVAHSCVALLLALCALCETCAAATIYVSSNGSDGNTGASENRAVATIGRALRLAEAMPAEARAIVIRIGAGHYFGQHFEASGNVNGVPIDISGAPVAPVVFEGNGQRGAWMTLVTRHGQSSKLTIENVEITHYETAIDAKGDRNNEQAWAGGMTIRHNRFTYIGDMAVAGTEPSTAAIRLVNSSRNVIAANEFAHIRNRQSCDVLHSIYVAHHSSGNLIEGNYFDDACGDAIRFRDESDSNIVKANSFRNAWYRSPISDWFCDRSVRNDCTKASGECPSVGNLLTDNKVFATGTSPVSLFIPWGGPPASCPRGQRAIVQ
jgi:hypothetical protein